MVRRPKPHANEVTKMTDQELRTLYVLTKKFAAWDTHYSSMYGRKMDQAVAADMASSLYGYGLVHTQESAEEIRVFVRQQEAERIAKDEKNMRLLESHGADEGDPISALAK